MKNLSRAFLLAVLCVVVFATAASAECAWVLWIITTGDRQTNPTWRPETAVSAQTECESALARNITEASSLPAAIGLKVTPLSSGYVTSWVDSNGTHGTQVTSLKCLPDTVDPRGAKGK